MVDLKSTLNLPDAEFTIPMRAGLPTLEARLLERWEGMGLYARIQEARQRAEPYVLHDGPPYTNNPIHIGTALNKILKDLVVKSRSLMGYRAPYVPGFDNHGLPIELAVAKKLADEGKQTTTVELRQACREHAAHYIGVQTDQFKRLGIFGLWDNPYKTMGYLFEAEIVRIFNQLVEKGYVYRGLRPVLWSPTSQTALADTEIVYKDDHVSRSIWVRFPLIEGAGLDAEAYAIAWTTTPWTIPANLALAFNQSVEYSLVLSDGTQYLIATDLVESMSEKIGLKNIKVTRTLLGKDFEGARFKHPIFDRESLGVLGDYVSTDEGTGIVHTAPGHGRDDFYTGQKYGLPVLCPVDERGILTDEAGEFAGTHYKKCDTVVTERLRELGNLMHDEPYTHSYPVAERDGQPVIFRATEQWFVSLEHDGLRERMLQEVESVVWYPRSGKNRIAGMVSNRPDWCISRQRPWGVGIPIFYGKESGQPVLDPAAIESVAALIAEEGSDAWYSREPSEILPPGYRHPETGETEFRKEVDVFDVWFDSGSTWWCVLGGNIEAEWRADLPVDLYLEGHDQHRGWFNSSLVLATAVRGAAPYKGVLTHGFVLDGEMRKMSKRAGNVVDPNDVCERHGADVLRLWAASVDFESDVPCSEEILRNTGEQYRRLRNTLRFLLGNLYDFEGGVELSSPLDRWMVARSGALVNEVLDQFERFKFNVAASAIHGFCVNELSAFYLDTIKDRVYCDGKDWASRRSAQAACHTVLYQLVRLLSPVLPFTTEEVYERIPAIKRLESVHLETLSRVEGVEPDQAFESLLDSRKWVFSAMEEWRRQSGVKDSQDLALRIYGPEQEFGHLREMEADLPLYFKVASVELGTGDRRAEFALSEYEKCERSRLRRADVSQVNGALLTERDRQVLQEMGAL